MRWQIVTTGSRMFRGCQQLCKITTGSRMFGGANSRARWTAAGLGSRCGQFLHHHSPGQSVPGRPGPHSRNNPISDQISNFSPAHNFSIPSDSTNDPASIGSWSRAILLATWISVGSSYNNCNPGGPVGPPQGCKPIHWNWSTDLKKKIIAKLLHGIDDFSDKTRPNDSKQFIFWTLLRILRKNAQIIKLHTLFCGLTPFSLLCLQYGGRSRHILWRDSSPNPNT